MTEVRFQQVESEEQKKEAGSLIREYLEWLNDRLKGEYGIEFDVEAMVLSDLTDPYKFHPPHGRFYLAHYKDQLAGVGCLKRLETGVGEVQRMYVPPTYRGKGIGRAIANRLIDDARSMGYRKLRLESLGFLDEAHSLYRSVGFQEIEPYADNSMESYQQAEQLDQYYSITVFMEMDLTKKHYPWLWFDADGTLFDYDQAEKTALQRAFQSVNKPFEPEYLHVYRRINQRLWQALERQEITPAVLKLRRFELLHEALQLAGSPVQMSTAFLEQLALCADLIDGAEEVLRALQATCQLAIVTNGLQAVQRSRLARSRIRDYISKLIISEEVGAAKPEAAFFAAAFSRVGQPAKSDVLLIGDSLSSDMQGGLDYGLDTCWYNPVGEPRPDGLPITYEIGHLRDLLKILM